MGALHEGHASLVRRSRARDRWTVASLFVNPTQFGPKEDFSKYPRPWKEDLRLLRRLGVQALYAPTPQSMYAADASTKVIVSDLTDTLCGSPRSRGPGHFTGVATVVAKLFSAVRPTRAYFGMKDFQQVRVIERMNRDLDFGVTIVRCPTVREKDGLALSSRNRYLSPTDRALAPRFHNSLQQGAKLLTSPRKMNLRDVIRHMVSDLETVPHLSIDYVEIVDPETLKPLTMKRRPALIAAAIRLGSTRLIDNLLVR